MITEPEWQCWTWDNSLLLWQSNVFSAPGSEDGKIHVWNAESGMKVAVLDGKHTGPITCLQFNPKFMTFASACSNMVSEDACRVEPHSTRDLLNKFEACWSKWRWYQKHVCVMWAGSPGHVGPSHLFIVRRVILMHRTHRREKMV